jgi:hypothetical protein
MDGAFVVWENTPTFRNKSVEIGLEAIEVACNE